MNNDRGAITVEAALSMFCLVIVVSAVIGVMATMAMNLKAIYMAGAAARSHALGV